MSGSPYRRREFLRSAGALGIGAGLTGAAGMGAILPRSVSAMTVTPEVARFRPEIEPVVRWIETTPRERILNVAVDQMKAGLSYRDLLAGLFLAGIRNIQPRPVGFKFHAVLVINSAHLIGQSAIEEDRLLPMFWALDQFKRSQAADENEGDWTLGAASSTGLPAPSEALRAFQAATDAWDSRAADDATTALCRYHGAAEVMEAFWRLAVRDQRNIGHKPIFAMQCWRTLQTIGWEHAEPVMRSLVFGLLDTQGDAPAPIGPYEANLTNAGRIREGWQANQGGGAGATQTLLAAMRREDSETVSAAMVDALNEGVSPSAVWDAILLAASELLLRAPGIIPLHAATSANALHFIFHASGDETTRKLALLQAGGWIPLFRGRTPETRPLEIDQLAANGTAGSGRDALEAAFAENGQDPRKAAEHALAYLDEGGSTDDLFAIGRRMIFHKADDSHQYKYGAAAWEEARLAGDPRWAARIAAASLAYFPSSRGGENQLMQRAREAVSRLS